MLKELRIRNFAVIEEIRLELEDGLTVLSGETGAGKSILVGALSLLLGERASSQVVRSGEDRAMIEGVFDIARRPDLADRCAEEGIDPGEGWLILRREVLREGRNRAWVNGSPATAGLIGALGSELVDLHGQHEHQALLHRGAQRRILDAYAGARSLAMEVAELHEAWREAVVRLARLQEQMAELLARADDLRFTLREIEAARLEEGEEDALRAEAERLEHSEELIQLSGELHEAVYGGERALVDRLGGLGRTLDALIGIDPRAEDFQELHDTALRVLEELGRRVGEYRSRVEHDPERLRRIRARQDELYRLKGKYGPELADVIRTGRMARTELDQAGSAELTVQVSAEEVRELERRLRDRALVLSRTRKRAARELETAVASLLPSLGLEGGRFRVELTPVSQPTRFGAEEVEFKVSLNPGFEPGPLADVASGGEMSRLMLALKTVLSAVDPVPCLVFDEIDAGVGGETAHRMAARLADLGRGRQVFVVTHLAQIAARADHHLQVEKLTEGVRALTRVRVLEAESRIRELARMLGGDPESPVSRSHAEELLAGAPT
ncbi:MAG: DNA repair protein RecN [Gemmatimonadota bacterium]